MAVRYPGHWLRTREQAMWQGIVLLIVLLPLVAWRSNTQPLGVGIGLSMLTLAPFAVALQASRFLAMQERRHELPTPEMAFVFRLVVNTPLTFGALLLVVLMSLR
jgi:hypothetical protein